MADDPTPYTSHPDLPAVSAEELVGEELIGSDPRRYPSTIGGVCYLGVLAVAGVALALVAFSGWRLGVRVLGVDLLVAAALRLVLPQEDAGMLAVRHKYLDALILVGAGVMLLFLAGDIPDQPSAAVLSVPR